MKKIEVIQYGLGPIGASILNLIQEKRGFKIIGAIDIDPEKVGKRLSELTGNARLSDIQVKEKIQDVKTGDQVKVAVHTTSSHIHDVLPQLREIAESGFHIVSSCEELSYPWREHEEAALELDGIAKGKGISILGTGVNPGFLMDTHVITLTGLCQRITRIECRRVQDASMRRLSFQKKIGAGLSLKEFKRRATAGTTRHVGFRESLWMIADSLQWKLDGIEETINPVVADKTLKSQYMTVEKGLVAGIDQTAIGIMAGEEVIRLNLLARLGCQHPREEVKIEGVPNVAVNMEGGVHGDIATASMIVNSIPKLINSKPGLHSMLDLPIPSALLGDVRQYLK